MWLGVSASYQSARAAFLSKRQRSAQSDLTPTFLHPGFVMAPSSKARSLASMPSEQWMAALLRDLLLLACVGPLLLPAAILRNRSSGGGAPPMAPLAPHDPREGAEATIGAIGRRFSKPPRNPGEIGAKNT